MSDPRRSEPGGDAQEPLRLVGFRIEDWRFAVRLEQVKTSIMPCSITRVFHVPDFVLGVISLRGTIVGVLDLGRLLGLSSVSGSWQRFIVVSAAGVQAAIPVHDVFRIPDVVPELLAPLPPSVTPAQKQYLDSIINTTRLEGFEVRTGEDTLTLVDVATVFKAPDIRALRGKP